MLFQLVKKDFLIVKKYVLMELSIFVQSLNPQN